MLALQNVFQSFPRLLEENSFYVFSRKGAVETLDLRNLLSCSTIFDSIDQNRIVIDDEASLEDISSTQFRELITSTDSSANTIHPDVMKYIQNHGLYGVRGLEDMTQLN